VLAQPRALRPPPADPDVDVVALREDPRVAARNGAELDHRTPTPAVLARVNIRDVPFERDSVPPLAEGEHLRGEPVDAVRADHDLRLGGGHVEANGRLALPELQRRCAEPVPEVRSRGRGRFGEVRVEPPPLGHQDERPLPSPLEPRSVAEPELEAVDDLLDDGVDRDRKLLHSAFGQAAAARLVAREALAVEQEHARARAREPQSRRRAGRPGPDDDRVEALHPASVRKNKPTSHVLKATPTGS